MNNVIMMGTLEGDAEVIYTSPDGNKSLYKFLLKVPKPYKSKDGTNPPEDLVNIKVWSTQLTDEYILHDQAYVGIEGRINSYAGKDYKNVVNDIIANKVIYLA
ncbi:single-stranded DNA-binding protein [Mesoplasma lactucae]|uniref:Single-stranded DNA-binding protein n=1 Tax=Mesoplasma lactucae ATCC 49193 TaxID=81460 RepID=A0A291IRA2_9MOLU|nr:single-stranded DNA-binding protein [Mesoplasma lactucae]ATG97319.1 single-stranded DNA-binding protein [Mesoplasma lactucae ATCC 49193]ATZ20230.1 single-strand DNA-binding protein [Mesoplasma lactucae ATCC 49193]MCL8216979.1 hypothetical protein [Mesoplasma lactucae ATCC 49193]